ncbi:MAG: hypothetical protein ABJF23_12285 [Bryobacteraceae bacterium]
MQAIRELEQLQRRLEAQIALIQAELDTISKTIKILERETPGAAAQMTVPVVASEQRIPPTPITEPKAIGLSDLCRQIMGDHWMAPVDVRDQLMEMGYHNTDKGKLLSSVYATLKRLSDSGEMESRKESGRTEFRRRLLPQAA